LLVLGAIALDEGDVAIGIHLVEHLTGLGLARVWFLVRSRWPKFMEIFEIAVEFDELIGLAIESVLKTKGGVK
jgi:hypothetical protein